MTSSALPGADLDVRRRRILFRAWHRGMREMDLIMGRFADAEVAGLSASEIEDLERLMEVPDRDLLSWIMGEAPAPENFSTPIFQRLKAFHTHDQPIHR